MKVSEIAKINQLYKEKQRNHSFLFFKCYSYHAMRYNSFYKTNNLHIEIYTPDFSPQSVPQFTRF